MKFGHFSDTAREYVITTPRTPLPWINYLGSEAFFSLVSHTAGRINRSRMAGDPPDIFLTPRLAHVGLLEFYKAEEVINEGKACVSRALPALETLLHRDFGHAHQGD